MNRPRIDDLLTKVDSKYALVTLAARRARQINNYYRNREEGSIDDIPPPLIDTRSKNILTIAMEEIAAGKISYRYRV
ncbi:MAG: DNA-directed RNA polymerase subunit omega [Thermoleophilia bacterium]|nr:DNA-directed RNA polymerase subunit omega [Actinomycetota bacterium]MCL6092428.1 DNA-directed RNA polymerase subunit omega [Actinomycetota bacterium]MDA8168011.1 DNA-directed RNA polymerase subunit omega [Actinomycetota bacterium]